MDIQQVMEKMYKDTHTSPAPIAEVVGRYEPEKGDNRFRLFITEKRQEYIRRLREERSRREHSVDRKCPLCRSYNAVIYEGHLAISPDEFPMYDYHMLIVPLKDNLSLEGLQSISQSYQLTRVKVTEDMLDCREHPTARDFDAEIKLVQNADYMVMQSMRRSGASVPEHIHAHAFKRNLMRFPLLKEENFSEVYQTTRMKVLKLKGPSYGFMVLGDCSQYGTVIDRFSKVFKLPFNLLITEAFHSVVVLYFPRTREIPCDPIYADWQFGVTEMLGLFETKNYEQFKNLSYEKLCQGLRDTSIQDHNIRRNMEEVLIQILNELT